MNRLLLAASVAATVLAGASVASAATFSDITMPSVVDGSRGATFKNDGGIAAGAFTDTFTFDWGAAGVTSGTISSSFTSAANDLNFTSVTLNGVEFNNLLGGTGLPEIRFTQDQFTASGIQTLIVRGISPGPTAIYSGTLTFTPSVFGGGVPEPAAWALMILGFGGVGVMLRRGRSGGLALATAA